MAEVNGAKELPTKKSRYLDMIIKAIQELKERNGSSRQSISKYVIANFDINCDANSASICVKSALKRGLTTGRLKHLKGEGLKGTFVVAGDEKTVESEKKYSTKSDANYVDKEINCKKSEDYIDYTKDERNSADKHFTNWHTKDNGEFEENQQFYKRSFRYSEDADISKRIDELDEVIRRWRADHCPQDKITYVISQWIRKQNRSSERSKRRLMSAVCFKCRKTGHKIADCPEANSTDEVTSCQVCYKCGSTEHVVSACKLITKGFPFANCFVCKKVGHLSKDCEENCNGLYPNGGSCRRCGQLDHFVKDCPSTLSKQQKDESISISMHENEDVDDEQTNFNHKNRRKQIKTVKI